MHRDEERPPSRRVGIGDLDPYCVWGSFGTGPAWESGAACFRRLLAGKCFCHEPTVSRTWMKASERSCMGKKEWQRLKNE